TVRGITQIIVGTGGADLRAVRRVLSPNSAAQVQGHFGVLKLTLGDGEYRHAFLDTERRIWDQGGRKCH
ncbi:MAG: alkaline phosphatase, partial [Gemmatimonadota bacterium]|nr:alkaline phosphatase [Gemmatimonadota bacterium]